MHIDTRTYKHTYNIFIPKTRRRERKNKPVIISAQRIETWLGVWNVILSAAICNALLAGVATPCSCPVDIGMQMRV